jgi:uroporphyrinogen-III decarboxylase
MQKDDRENPTIIEELFDEFIVVQPNPEERAAAYEIYRQKKLNEHNNIQPTQQDIEKARARVGNLVALQGNMDPVALYAQPEIIIEKVKCILHKYGTGSGHVFNLGHGILPDINPDHVKAMVDAVHKFSPIYHT